jgi:hypothetical protein
VVLELPALFRLYRAMVKLAVAQHSFRPVRPRPDVLDL